MKKISISILFFILILSSSAQTKQVPKFVSWSQIEPGDARTELYFPLLVGKKVAIVANHTSMIGKIHLVDTLLNSSIDLIKVFSPEHGFRGNAADGAIIKNGVDKKTGLAIISLYGNHKKPTTDDLKDIEVVLFDLQDVGCRFYTYFSTLTYVMEACAEHKITLIILDRPNPKGAFYVVAKLPIDDSDIFCQWLLEDFNYENRTLMLAPASGFYSTEGKGKDEVRISYVLNVEDLKGSIKCLDEALKVYPGKK